MSKTTSGVPTDSGGAAESATTTRAVPAYAAGPGLPETAFAPARAAGFAETADERGNVTFTSPDGRLQVAWGPESYRYHTNPTGGLWQVKYVDASSPAEGWSAQFGDNAPAEAISAFISALTAPDGLDPDRA
jgi:hypothetical protein